jgi:hypothetical protein
MQTECADDWLVRSVGLQSTPSSVVRARAEGREIVSAANGSAAVEDNRDTGVITTWAASARDVCDGSALRLAHGDGRFPRRGLPLSCIDCAGGPAFSRSFVHRGFGGHRAQRVEWLAPQIVVARLGGGIANT